MTRIITVANQKGGVGKTTTVVNVSACLARAGNRVLVVDLDPQANCTAGLGVDPTSLEFSVYEVLAQPKKFRIFTLEDVIVRTPWPNLEIVPSHVNLSGVELEIVNKLGREAILKKGLREVGDRYDFILLDTPPSLSLLTVNALVAASEIIVVMKAEPWSLDGIDNLLETLTVVEEELNPGVGLSGILVNMLEPRAHLSHEILNRLAHDERLSGRLFSTTIRKNVKLAEAADKGLPVIYHDPACHGATAYQQLMEEIVEGRRAGARADERFEQRHDEPMDSEGLDDLECAAERDEGAEGAEGAEGDERAEEVEEVEEAEETEEAEELEISPYQITPSLIFPEDEEI
jgi:chromosome partitioning protein